LFQSYEAHVCLNKDNVVNIIESDLQKPILLTDVATQTSSTSEANILITDQFNNIYLAIQLEEKQINQCFNISQD
jgi:hypothetical protein